ncbi:MAG: hotdog fold thioesterase [Rhodanobacteraceae bacterium]
MPIWKAPVNLEQLARDCENTMVAALGMRITEVGDDSVSGTMPVDHRTRQPFGLLHGGASVALAETLGSTAANLCCNPRRERAVGLDINANHVRAAHSGHVHGTARPVHVGRSTQVWEIRIVDDYQQLVCIARLTCAVVPIPLTEPDN